jgi:hypothetical protein
MCFVQQIFTKHAAQEMKARFHAQLGLQDFFSKPKQKSGHEREALDPPWEIGDTDQRKREETMSKCLLEELTTKQKEE